MIYHVKLIMKVAVMTAVLAVPIYQGVFRVPAAARRYAPISQGIGANFPS